TDALLVPNAALRWRPQMALVSPSYREGYEQSLRRRAAADEGRPGMPSKGKHNRATVWIEDGAGFVKPVKVRTGLTDGNLTEVVEVVKEKVEPDTPLVVA